MYVIVSSRGHTGFGCTVGVGVAELVLDVSSRNVLELLDISLVVLSDKSDDVDVDGSSDGVFGICSELVVLDGSSVEVLELVDSSLVMISGRSDDVEGSSDVVLETCSELVELVDCSLAVLGVSSKFMLEVV